MLRAFIEQRLRAAWQRRGPLAMLLWPLSRLYGALAARQRAVDASKAVRLSVPVVVVAAFLLLRLSQSGKLKGDAAIALLSSSALAIGVMRVTASGSVSQGSADRAR